MPSTSNIAGVSVYFDSQYCGNFENNIQYRDTDQGFIYIDCEKPLLGAFNVKIYDKHDQFSFDEVSVLSLNDSSKRDELCL